MKTTALKLAISTTLEIPHKQLKGEKREGKREELFTTRGREKKGNVGGGGRRNVGRLAGLLRGS